MKNNFMKKEKGITLIALVVTIIVLLILAGVSIAVLTGENGILNRATEAKTTSKIAEVEEEARLIYTDYLIGNRAHGTALADLETIYNYDKKNFTMKEDTQGTETVNGIKTNLNPDLTSTAPSADTFTFTSDDTSTKTITISKDSTSSNGKKYYAVIEGKDYEMSITNGVVYVSRTPTTGGSGGATLTNVTATANPTTGVVNVSTSGNVVSITRDTNATSGSATITITGTIGETTYTKVAKVSIKSYASNTSKVGYYADVNGDGLIKLEDDGIIFADLAVRTQHTGLSVSYDLAAVDTTTLKNYEESTTNVTGDVAKFGEQKWIKAAGTTGKNRFYVMALKDIDTNYHYWYYNAYNYSGKTPITADGIGIDEDNKAVGRKNTEAIMAVYDKATDNGGWGLKATGQTYTDMFDVLKTKYERDVKWFVPSRDD